MEAFWKASAIVILAVILGVAIGKEEKDIATVLSIVTCCIVMMVAMQYLSDVGAFLWELGDGAGYTDTMLKISGVALMSELMSLIGSDAGNRSLGKAIQILGNAVILFLSLPAFQDLLSIIQLITGSL